MSAITIRQLPDVIKERLRMRAAANGRSMEAEARAILLDALDADLPPDLSWINHLIEVGDKAGGADLPTVEDSPATAAEFA